MANAAEAMNAVIIVPARTVDSSGVKITTSLDQLWLFQPRLCAKARVGDFADMFRAGGTVCPTFMQPGRN